MERSGQLHDPTVYAVEKRTGCPLNRGVHGLQSRAGRFGEGDNLLSLAAIKSVYSEV